MIPEFDEYGHLPPGIHPATLEEIAERFGRQSEVRQAEIESARWMVDLARRAGVQRIILNGSFVTDVLEPNDIDCVLLAAPGYLKDAAADAELRRGLPFLGIALVDQDVFDVLVLKVFASDRQQRPKGMIEVIS